MLKFQSIHPFDKSMNQWTDWSIDLYLVVLVDIILYLFLPDPYVGNHRQSFSLGTRTFEV